MRGLLTLVGIALIVLIVLIYFGFINIDQTRRGYVQAPAFHADVGRVSVGTENKTVSVPKISVEKAPSAPAADQPR